MFPNSCGSSCPECSSESATDWHKDWRPAAYPTTPEERAAAAKKYNMLPEDYEPMPDDGYGRGDYPALPLDPWEMKDPWEDYDFPRERRFYGEPIGENFDISFANIATVREDDDKFWHDDVPSEKWWSLGFIVFYVSFFSLMTYLYIGKDFKSLEREHGPIQFPEDGVTHYTFEPIEQ